MTQTHNTTDTPTIWAISDTHLSFAKPKDQTRFGPKWRNHTARLKAAWKARIRPQDVVLLPGDLSWAHSPQRVQPDVDWIASLPGRKVLARGNHDFWWRKLPQVQEQILHHDTMYAVQGNSVALGGVIICGTMGHIAPNDPYYEKHKYKSYQRELRWLGSALDEAQTLRTNGEPIILMMHYPPYTSDGHTSGFSTLIQQYQPDICVYGHLHYEKEWSVAANGLHDGTHYHLVACDYLKMIPRQVWPPPERD